MLEKTFKNVDLGIELKSFIDYKQNIWFLGKDVAEILGYSDTNQAIRKHVDEEDKYKGAVILCKRIRFLLLIIILKIGICKKV